MGFFLMLSFIVFYPYIRKIHKKKYRMNKKKLLRIDPSNDEEVWTHSLIENGINPPLHIGTY